MVEYTMSLDTVFGSLADPTRRDILRRVAGREQSVGQIAQHYDLTFAAISKHLKVLEKARLIIKRRRGKEQIVALSPGALADADAYLQQYRELWESRLDKLEALLEQEQLKSQGGQHGRK
ncbi:MAG TPA: metalloregulator ArsR/SmtB family transcription factor [Candidatus Saccharimonadales bacterium]|jgi:DNA-binding transcriptional ArsR family regulator|nr:metalloregulator ArsR/SmtB family transcription factor [Candidatus Saccharimonadales bacterium]